MQTLIEVHNYYHNLHLEITDSPVWQFIKSLGIDADESSLQLSIGLADRSINSKLKGRNTTVGKAQRKALQSLGVLRSTGFESLSGLVIPFFNKDGVVVNLSSYCIGQKHRGMTNTLNHHGCIKVGASTTGILVENPTDVMVLVGLGLHQTFTICCIPKGGNVESIASGLDELLVCDRSIQVSIPTKLYKLPAHGNFLDWIRLQSVGADDARKVFDSAELITEQQTPASGNTHTEFTGGSLCDDVKHDGTHYYKTIGDHHYRITGLERNQGFHSLKITLKVWEFELYYIDTIDLTIDKQRVRFVARASEELGLSEITLKKDLGKLLLVVEQLQERRFAEDKLEPSIELSPNEIKVATDYLKQPNLIEAIQRDFDSCGVVGEDVNRLVGYLCCTSRILSRPLAVIIQSSSAAGKTTLMNAVLKMFPTEEQINYSALTGQSLYYLGDTNIDGKVISVAEEEGASRASYALKLLLSEGELSIATTGKDSETGATTTVNYKVSGRVMLFMTTTALDVDEELQNRCLVLSVDERSEQTSAIHHQQRVSRTLQGYIQKQEAKKIQALHHNIQRVLKPYVVVNPFINDLTFSSVSTRTRRDHEKYLTLIETITILHQYQRKVVKKEYGDDIIEALVVDQSDVALANVIADQVFATTLDSLPAHTRKVWDKIKIHINSEVIKQKLAWYQITFTRRTIRELTGHSVTGVKTHIQRLIEAEFITTASNDEGSKYSYQSLVNPSDTEHFDVLGLLSY